MTNLIVNRSLLASLGVSIVFQLMIVIGFYVLVYIEPLPRLITSGNMLLQTLNTLPNVPAGGPNLMRSFVLDGISSYQSIATLLATIATALLVGALIQILVFVVLLRSTQLGRAQ